MALGIHLEWTPNPNTLKYVLNRPVLPIGSLSFSTREEAKALSGLADKLLGIEGIEGVTLGTSFVSVTKGESGEWLKMNDAVMDALEAHLGAGEPVLTEAGAAQLEAKWKRERTDTEARIEAVLEAEIRPALAMDGGDVTLERFEDGIAYVHMRGACAGCPSASRTLKMGIEVRLKEAIEELEEVVAL